MTNIKKQNPLVLVFAIIGVFALIYACWILYQHQVAEDQRREFFSATPGPGMPDILHATPGPPPPQ
jgi:hypothetical protein